MSYIAAAKHALLDGLPKVELLHCKLPIVSLAPRLSEHLDSTKSTSIWFCREDITSGLAFGGNKLRKLEFVLPDAVEQGADTLVTTGGIQSNHMRQTAAVASKLGMKAVLIPKDMVEIDSDAKDNYLSAGNVQLNSLLGAEVLEIGTQPDEAVKTLTEQGRKPYWIPAGASQHPAGGFGYARWALLLAMWEKENGVYFDTILTACGGGSTLAGMVVGNKIAGSTRRMVGVSIFTEYSDAMADKVIAIADRAAHNLSIPDSFVSKDDFEIDDRFHAGAYGRCDAATAEAVRIVAGTEGILLDPVYTGKVMAALMSGIRNREFKDSKNILFVHTGGQSAMSAYPSLR